MNEKKGRKVHFSICRKHMANAFILSIDRKNAIPATSYVCCLWVNESVQVLLFVRTEYSFAFIYTLPLCVVANQSIIYLHRLYGMKSSASWFFSCSFVHFISCQVVDDTFCQLTINAMPIESKRVESNLACILLLCVIWYPKFLLFSLIDNLKRILKPLESMEKIEIDHDDIANHYDLMRNPCGRIKEGNLFRNRSYKNMGFLGIINKDFIKAIFLRPLITTMKSKLLPSCWKSTFDTKINRI